jgi:hypothetical protein
MLKETPAITGCGGAGASVGACAVRPGQPAHCALASMDGAVNERAVEAEQRDVADRVDLVDHHYPAVLHRLHEGGGDKLDVAGLCLPGTYSWAEREIVRGTVRRTSRRSRRTATAAVSIARPRRLDSQYPIRADPPAVPAPARRSSYLDACGRGTTGSARGPLSAPRGDKGRSSRPRAATSLFHRAPRTRSSCSQRSAWFHALSLRAREQS